MKIISNIFFVIIIIFLKDINSQSSVSDSMFSHKVNYKYWAVCWNDSLAIQIDARTSEIDTIYSNFSVYDDSDTTSSMPYYYNNWHNMLSIVGPYLSFRVSYAGSGGAHPIYGHYNETYNIETKKQISLDEIFDSYDIYIALLNNSTVTKYLRQSNPSDLNDLLKNLDGECDIKFYSILNDFAFYDTMGDSVIIDFGLTHGCEVLRGKFTSIKIMLPIPINIISLLNNAKENKHLETYLE